MNWARLVGKPDHSRRVASSRKVLARLRGFSGDGAAARAFGYLRTIDPFVYEETVLSALENAGALVVRNRRYTGDGGIDGRCWWPGLALRYLAVQCKRYGGAITPQHLNALSRQVTEGGHAGGLFVHCGRTGPASYEVLHGAPVQLVSGARMLNLLLRARLRSIR